jgi:hypothetical protein
LLAWRAFACAACAVRCAALRSFAQNGNRYLALHSLRADSRAAPPLRAIAAASRTIASMCASLRAAKRGGAR